MSTSVSGPRRKKISSCVRPGVWEVRASALRPVSALIRLDLPTLERPAKAISIPSVDGSACSDEAAERTSHSPAKNLRAASSSSEVKAPVFIPHPFRLCPPGRKRQDSPLWLALGKQTAEIVPQFDLNAVPAHNDALLDDRESV